MEEFSPLFQSYKSDDAGLWRRCICPAPQDVQGEDLWCATLTGVCVHITQACWPSHCEHMRGFKSNPPFCKGFCYPPPPPPPSFPLHPMGFILLRLSPILFIPRDSSGCCWSANVLVTRYVYYLDTFRWCSSICRPVPLGCAVYGGSGIGQYSVNNICW